MTDVEAETSSVARLRRQFDEAFAKPIEAIAETRDRYVLVRVGLDGHVYAIALSRITALLPAKKLAPVPSSMPALLGLVAVRSNVVPVYGIASLLGLAQEPARWFAQCECPEPLGLGFGQLEGYLEVATGSDDAARSEGDGEAPTRRMVEGPQGAVGVLQLDALVQTIRDRIGVPSASKET